MYALLFSRNAPERTGTRRNAPERNGKRRNTPERAETRRNAPERAGTCRNEPERARTRRNAPERARTRQNAPERARTRQNAPERPSGSILSRKNTECIHTYYIINMLTQFISITRTRLYLLRPPLDSSMYVGHDYRCHQNIYCLIILGISASRRAWNIGIIGTAKY